MTRPIADAAAAYRHPDYIFEDRHANIPQAANAALDLCSIDDERGLVTTAEVLKPLVLRWAADPRMLLPYPVRDPRWQATLAATVRAAFGATGLPDSSFVFGDGTYELFKELAGFVLRRGTLVGAGPVYPEFAAYFTAAGGRFRPVNDTALGFPADALHRVLDADDDIVAIYADLPYNATGGWPDTADVVRVATHAAERQVLMIIDEAYANFLGRDHTYMPLVAAHPNVIVLRSLSKGFDLRGLRFGAAAVGAWAAPVLNEIRSPYAPGQPAAQAAAFLLTHGPDVVAPLTRAIRAAKVIVHAAALRAGLGVRPTHPAAPNMRLFDPRPGLADRLAALGVRVSVGSQFALTTPPETHGDVRLRVPLLPARLEASAAALEALARVTPG